MPKHQYIDWSRLVLHFVLSIHFYRENQSVFSRRVATNITSPPRPPSPPLGPPGNVALSSKRSTTVSTVTTVNSDRHFIDKRHGSSRQKVLSSRWYSFCNYHSAIRFRAICLGEQRVSQISQNDCALLSNIQHGNWDLLLRRSTTDHQSMRTVSNRDQHRHFAG